MPALQRRPSRGDGLALEDLRQAAARDDRGRDDGMRIGAEDVLDILGDRPIGARQGGLQRPRGAPPLQGVAPSLLIRREAARLDRPLRTTLDNPDRLPRDEAPPRFAVRADGLLHLADPKGVVD